MKNFKYLRNFMLVALLGVCLALSFSACSEESDPYFVGIKWEAYPPEMQAKNQAFDVGDMQIVEYWSDNSTRPINNNKITIVYDSSQPGVQLVYFRYTYAPTGVTYECTRTCWFS